MLASPSLIEYGIQTEESDLRAHVCPKVQRIYVYPTANALRVIGARRYRIAHAYQGKVQTAAGYLVPPRDIPRCREYAPPLWIWERHQITKDMSTSERGERALKVFMEAVQRGYVALPLSQAVVRDFQQQISGIDVAIRMDVRVQVKCDYAGGPKAYGGTGNLFLQIAERNPHNRH